mmetsp:Transcript_116817/g.330500  ORF Transcript_116817/g.330500 Transcript_116817/m.330500 type:complete len:104 (-) Transcript_116817:490-801(-)
MFMLGPALAMHDDESCRYMGQHCHVFGKRHRPSLDCRFLLGIPEHRMTFARPSSHALPCSCALRDLGHGALHFSGRPRALARLLAPLLKWRGSFHLKVPASPT